MAGVGEERQHGKYQREARARGGLDQSIP